MPRTRSALAFLAANVVLLTASTVSAQSPVVYRGLEHTAVGAAILTRNGGNLGTLTLTNIGSSGQDGVSIDAGALWSDSTDIGVALSFDPLQTVGLSDAQFVCACRGTLDGGPEQSLCSLTHTKTGTQSGSVSIDFSPLGVTSHLIEVLSGDTLVYWADSLPANFTYRVLAPVNASMRTPSIGSRVQANEPIPGLDCIAINKPLKPTPKPRPDPPPKAPSGGGSPLLASDKLGIMVLPPSESEIDLGDGSGPHIGDAVAIYSGTISSNVVINRIVITASNYSQLTLKDEALLVFQDWAYGFPNRVLGDATYLACASCAADGGPGLVVSNIGSSGNDGLSVDIGDAGSFDVGWDPPDPLGSAPVGAYIHATATGSVNRVPGQSLGTLRVTKQATDYAITADLSPIGSSSHHVLVYRGGIPVADFPAHTGPIGTASAWPLGVGEMGWASECKRSYFPSGTVFQIDGAPHVGDELRVLAEGGNAAIGFRTGLALRASELPTMTLTNEDGSTTIITAVKDAEMAPPANRVEQNRPNPFNPETVIPFSLGMSGRVTIRIYNIAGQLVRTLVDGNQSAGPHVARWSGQLQDGSQAASGIYLYRITYPNGTTSAKRMAVLR